MKSFNDYQTAKDIQSLKEDILRIASELPESIINEAINLFEDPFQSNSWVGSLGNNLKSAYNSFQNSRQQTNQDNPVGNSYNNLSRSLDQFIGAVQQHPIGKNQQQLIGSLKTFRSNLSQQGADLSHQMRQFNQTNAMNRITNNNNGNNGTALNNAGSGTSPVAGQSKQMDANDVVQHLKEKGFSQQDINYYLSKIKKNNQPNNSNPSMSNLPINNGV